MSSSSCSICACTLAGTPPPAPAPPFVGAAAQVRRRRLALRHDLGGVLVAQFVQRVAAARMRDLEGLGEQIHRKVCASRSCVRRCRSALGCSSLPHSVSGLPRRIAVSTSCKGLRERRCMWMSPDATSGMADNALTSRSRCSHISSSSRRSSSTASQERPMKCCSSQRAMASNCSGELPRCGAASTTQSASSAASISCWCSA